MMKPLLHILVYEKCTKLSKMLECMKLSLTLLDNKIADICFFNECAI